MGENHILNAIDYFDLEVPVFMQDQNGYISTKPLGSNVTDSAAGGTALATGQKVYNSKIARDADDNDIKQITSYAKEAGMRTGVITTDVLTGATPAAFSSHAGSRNSTDLIIKNQAKSDVDLLIGQGSSSYEFYQTLFETEGYSVAFGEEDMVTKQDEEKLVAFLPEVGSDYINGNTEDFQLDEMTRFALDFLENDNGFFLMVEGAYIDKYSHDNLGQNV